MSDWAFHLLTAAPSCERTSVGVGAVPKTKAAVRRGLEPFHLPSFPRVILFFDFPTPSSASAGLSIRQAVERSGAGLPLPAHGQTLRRWRALAAIAAHDLSLVKLFEGHADALAIMAELGAPAAPPHSIWGTWCAEPPSARLELRAGDGAEVRLQGTKAWCSGAAQLSHALVSAWNADGEQCLAAVELRQPAVTVTGAGWHAVGMADTGSVDVRFEQARATPIGAPGDYLHRPGFWQGGAGIAACWWGGAWAIGSMTRAFCGARADAHAQAHLGAIDVALSASAAGLREAARWIDANPTADARRVALRTRAAVEAACDAVLRHAARATGAGPLCREPRFARALADLPVYLRQSHAERDLAALGALLVEARDDEPWPL